MNESLSNHIKTLLEVSSSFPINKEVNPDFDFSNQTILITGAAGTIGSGLSKLLATSTFKNLILLDNAETPLYYLQKEFELHRFSNIHFILADIRDNHAMEEIFKAYNPSYIFHTAAYKHVPMMESNPYEAVKLNILATKHLADLALKHRVKTFLFISTDKAVNPISVMGMTKRIGELYLESLNLKNSTRFLTTRFGNILGSNGSLIPLFKKQLDLGIPLTITGKEVTRYFISNKKACLLILKIAVHNHWEHALFTFKMGDPIRIIDVALVFLEINRLNIKNNIEMIGLRPGEKYHETFVSDTEVLKSTDDTDIMYITSKKEQKAPTFNWKSIEDITPLDRPSQIKAILERSI